MCSNAIGYRSLAVLSALVILGFTAFATGCDDTEPSNNGSEDATSDTIDTVSDDAVSDTESDTTDATDSSADTTEDADGGSDGGSGMTDLLFVIDNSGGMCEEQNAFSEQLDTFVGNLDFDRTSYHFGVTTTHETPEGLPQDNFAARYGELSSEPDPVPGGFGSCGSSPDKVMDALERAIACTSNPSEYSDLTQWDTDTRNCVEDRSTCANEDFRLEDLFPPQTAYRTIPRIIDSEAYRGSDGTVDEAQLVADLRCATFVGTRGWAYEKGLGAAVEAVSPEKATVNSGFIREASEFAAVFVSDENDCTHDGGIDELNAGACQDDPCAFENSTQVSPDESALVSIAELKSTLVEHLQTAKDRSDFSEDDVFVAGLYGTPQRYEGDSYTPSECGEDSYPGVPASCPDGDYGAADSSDRYHRFVQAFSAGYPEAGSTDPGKLCSAGDFGVAMSDIGGLLATWP
jgi:hypothetical protein